MKTTIRVSREVKELLDELKYEKSKVYFITNGLWRAKAI